MAKHWAQVANPLWAGSDSLTPAAGPVGLCPPFGVALPLACLWLKGA